MTGLQWDYFSEFRDSGIIIAGGGQGIGAALVRGFHQLGAQVLILDKNQEEAEKVASGCKGLQPLVITGDLADEKERKDIIAKAAQALHGNIRVFISTIGLDSRISFSGLAQADMERLMRVNFYAPFFAARDFMPLIRKAGGGAICLFTSRHGSEIFEPDMAGYGCAKAALDNGINRLAQAAGAENSPENIIRVFGFCPGWVQTENQKSRFSGAQFQEALREQLIPVPTMPEDVVPAVVFAVSSQAKILSGTILRFDGGDGQIKSSAVTGSSKAQA
jgi:NAD(P)-dependent dehydrogenase (short-subunit alcohol dehydrogenase family)